MLFRPWILSICYVYDNALKNENMFNPTVHYISEMLTVNKKILINSSNYRSYSSCGIRPFCYLLNSCLLNGFALLIILSILLLLMLKIWNFYYGSIVSSRIFIRNLWNCRNISSTICDLYCSLSHFTYILLIFIVYYYFFVFQFDHLSFLIFNFFCQFLNHFFRISTNC